MCPICLQAVRCPRFVQGPGGQAAADGADGRPHVCCVRKNHCRHLQGDGPEKETEAVSALFVVWCSRYMLMLAGALRSVCAELQRRSYSKISSNNLQRDKCSVLVDVSRAV